MNHRFSRLVVSCGFVGSLVAMNTSCSMLPLASQEQAQSVAAHSPPVRLRLVQLNFGRAAAFAACAEPACPTVTPKTLAVAREPVSTAPVREVVLQPTALAPVDPAPAVAASAREAPIEPPAPPMPAEPVSNAVPAESGTRHILVTFPFGSAALTAEAKSVLRTSLVRTRAHERIVISGRTDSIGSEEVNQQLAMARALAVRNYMRDVVPELPNYISIDARGRCCFIASNDDEAGRSKNRRVEVVFTGRGVM